MASQRSAKGAANSAVQMRESGVQEPVANCERTWGWAFAGVDGHLQAGLQGHQGGGQSDGAAADDGNALRPSALCQLCGQQAAAP